MNTPVPGVSYPELDLLATMVAIVQPNGQCRWANTSLEGTMGLSRRTLQRGNVLDWLVEPKALRDTLNAVVANQVATGRFDAQLKLAALAQTEPLPVHVIVKIGRAHV